MKRYVCPICAKVCNGIEELQKEINSHAEEEKVLAAQEEKKALEEKLKQRDKDYEEIKKVINAVKNKINKFNSTYKDIENSQINFKIDYSLGTQNKFEDIKKEVNSINYESDALKKLIDRVLGWD